jgi:hypothetical protein
MSGRNGIARYGIAAFVGCVYTSASIWVVASQGRAYRESLERDRAGRAVASIPAAESTGQVERPATVAAIANDRPQPADGLAKPNSPKETGSRATVRKARRRPASEPDTAANSPTVAQPAAKSAPRAGVAANVATRAVLDPFWNQPVLTKSWDLDRLTRQDEVVFGRELHDVIVQMNPAASGTSRQRVFEAAKPLLELRDKKDHEYEFTILDSDIPNIFSHPGGFIYLSRKLLEMIPEDEDYALEFAIAHEIAHLELEHAVQCLGDKGVRSFKDGTLQKLYFLILPYAYPTSLEFAADQWAYTRMKRLGRSDHDCLAFLRKLRSYARANGFDDGRGKPEDLTKIQTGPPESRVEYSPLENHLRAHPAAWERLDNLRQLSGPGAGKSK